MGRERGHLSLILTLEEISPQNGPPKKINKIIFINFGGRKEKTTFLFVFLTYLLVFSLKIRPGELVGCIIKFCIQRVPTWHTFDRPRYPKNKKYLKNVMMLDAEFNFASNDLSRSKFE